MPDDEVIREPREPKLGIDVRRVNTDLPLPINRKPSKPRRVCIRNSVELARYGYTLGFSRCEAAMRAILGLSRDHSEQCRTGLVKVMSVESALSAPSRNPSEEEPDLKQSALC